MWAIPELPALGPFQLQPFGLLVITGIGLGTWFGRGRARAYGVVDEDFWAASIIVLATGLVTSHVFSVLLYLPFPEPAELLPELLRIWEGMSSLGGLVGALLGSLYVLHIHRGSWRVYADFMIQGWVVGWVFGRLGCTLTNDHPGRLTDFVLAVTTTTGPRHNLGLYELLLTLFVLLPGILWLHRRNPPAGSHVVFVLGVFAPARLLLDFLRAADLPGSDPRYAGLTTVQYCCLATILAVAVLAWRIRRG